MEIIQKRGKTSTRFAIKSKNELEIETSSKTRGEVFQIELRTVIETPSRQRFQPGYVDPSVILWWAIASVFLGSSLLALFSDLKGFAIILSVFSVPGALVGIVRSRQLRATSYDIFVFESRFGGTAFVMEANKPDEETFEQFLTNLKRAIRSVSPDPISINAGDALSGQLAKLHDLFQQELLTEVEFGAAKERLLNQEIAVERRIGFQAGYY